jgi:hypothetical protein|uniref:Potassium channel domain-containing protein n=1 Tax=Panagrolaimus sp. PS1159 TaxID=55785 RepID=A0AC35F038_9BILA
MLLRMRKWVLVNDDTATKIQRISPYLFLATLIGYLLFGAGSFWLFEKQYVSRNVRQFYLKLAVNRQQFAREITHKLFNDTKNLFVIMDLNQSNRVQAELISSLRSYEHHLNISRPKDTEWNFQGCLNYAWSLLTTLGHSTQYPKTVIGQLFALAYTIIGVPLFVITLLLLAHRIVYYLKKKDKAERKRKLKIFVMLLTIFFTYLFCFALILYYCDLVETFWRAINVAIFSSFTVHTIDYTRFSEADKLLTQFLSTISILLGLITVYYGIIVYESHESATDKVTSVTTPLPHGTPATTDIPRFNIIQFENGETKLETIT